MLREQHSQERRPSHADLPSQGGQRPFADAVDVSLDNNYAVCQGGTDGGAGISINAASAIVSENYVEVSSAGSESSSITLNPLYDNSSVTALGNITSGRISMGQQDLPTAMQPLNVVLPTGSHP